MRLRRSSRHVQPTTNPFPLAFLLEGAWLSHNHHLQGNSYVPPFYVSTATAVVAVLFARVHCVMATLQIDFFYLFLIEFL
jgi:hypothetical protein